MIFPVAFLLCAAQIVSTSPIASNGSHAEATAKMLKTNQPAARMRPVYTDNKPSESSIVNWYDSTRGSSSAIIAGMRLTASVPSVNLENVPGLLAIQCTNNKVTVTFDSIAEVKNWPNKDTLLIIASRYNCGVNNAGEFSMRLSKSSTVNKAANSLLFVTVDAEAAGVTGSYEIFATPVTESRHANFVSKRTAVPSSLSGVNNPNDLIVPLNLDMSINKKVTLPLAKVGTLTTGCTPCGIHGASTVIIRAFGGLYQKPGISMEWSGNLNMAATMSFDLQLGPGAKISSEVTLVEYPITPINIPGILILGPDVMLNARADIALISNTTVHATMSMSMPQFRAFYSSAEPTSVTGFKPIYDLTSDDHINMNGNVQVALIPKIAVVAKVFGTDFLHTSLGLDTTADIKFNVKSTGHVTERGTGRVGTTGKNRTTQGCISLAIGTKLVGEIFSISTDLQAPFFPTNSSPPTTNIEALSVRLESQENRLVSSPSLLFFLTMVSTESNLLRGTTTSSTNGAASGMATNAGATSSNIRPSISVISPNVVYTDTHILSNYTYHDASVTTDSATGDITVIPTEKNYHFKVDRKLPKLGLMLVGWGGNNGSTLTASLLANRNNVSWRTKEGLQTPNYYGSVFQSSTVKIGTDSVSSKDVYVPFSSVLPMVHPNDIVIGGWDISGANLAQAMERAKDRADNLLSGSKQDHLDRIRKDIRDFKLANDLDRVIVLWTANTERFSDVILGVNDSADNMLRAVKLGHEEIAPSTIFALASILEGSPFINGSPQNTFVPGVMELAQRESVFIGGDDFKSGQTKIKSVLVDFLVNAGIKPVAITSYNHLGNNDGMNLSAPEQFRSKEISKSNVVDDMVDANHLLYKDAEKPDHIVVIKYCPAVGDSKRALDEYVSEIFMGGKSTISIYNVCEDSLLASPLILDLALMTELFTRITYKTKDNADYVPFHSVLSVLSYMLKAPLVPAGTPVVNALSKQRSAIENILRACIGLAPQSDMSLEHRCF
ncbi:hypothetical protein BASA84_001626 [Batrachochytrium salamandrivorans]|nr:hypothetical protein BASA84_001626 [Batrachochytrium salamandrivorans]